MADLETTVDLARLRLTSGEARRIELQVPLPTLQYSGAEYALGEVQATLDIAKMANSGFSLRLRFVGAATGPCLRCLEDLTIAPEVDVREIDQPDGGEELTSPYIDDHDVLDVGAWARDAVALSLPVGLSCAEPETCPNLPQAIRSDDDEADAPPAQEPVLDPRWAKLSELRFDEHNE